MPKGLITTQSVFGKKIELASSVWFDKILKDHPEFGENKAYLQEIVKAVKDPDYVVIG